MSADGYATCQNAGKPQEVIFPIVLATVAEAPLLPHAGGKSGGVEGVGGAPVSLQSGSLHNNFLLDCEASASVIFFYYYYISRGRH